MIEYQVRLISLYDLFYCDVVYDLGHDGLLILSLIVPLNI